MGGMEALEGEGSEKGGGIVVFGAPEAL